MTNAMEKFQRETIGACATSARDTRAANVGCTRRKSHVTSHITSARTRAPVVIIPLTGPDDERVLLLELHTESASGDSAHCKPHLTRTGARVRVRQGPPTGACAQGGGSTAAPGACVQAQTSRPRITRSSSIRCTWARCNSTSRARHRRSAGCGGTGRRRRCTCGGTWRQTRLTRPFTRSAPPLPSRGGDPRLVGPELVIVTGQCLGGGG